MNSYIIWPWLSPEMADTLLTSAGIWATEMFSGALVLLSLMVRKRRVLQRSLLLAATGMSLIGYQYLRTSATFDDRTDWTTLWQVLSPWAKRFTTFIGFFIPYALAWYQSATDRNRWDEEGSVSKLDLASSEIRPFQRFLNRSVKIILVRLVKYPKTPRYLYITSGLSLLAAKVIVDLHLDAPILGLSVIAVLSTFAGKLLSAYNTRLIFTAPTNQLTERSV